MTPVPLFNVQFRAIQHYPPATVVSTYCRSPWNNCLAKLKTFDTTFSMGVLYHRRSPMEHLTELRETLVPGGQLVLETLVVEGG